MPDDHHRHRRRSVRVGVGLLLAALLTACTSTSGSSGSSETPTPAASSTVTSRTSPAPTSIGSASSPTTGTASAGAECPAGTAADERLCVADSDTARQAADIITSAFADGKPGAVLAGVWQNGDPLVVGALGETMTGVPATVDMHFVTGNSATPMIMTVLLQLVDEGTLSLDDTLSKWYPDLPKADVITLAMLARSMTGYSHFPADDEFQKKLYADPFQYWAPDELIAIGTAGGTKFEPGTDWLFSDTNPMILSQVIEKTTGRPLSELIQERILTPLQMSNTTQPYNANLPEPVLHGFSNERGVWEDTTYWNPTWIWYNGGMHSTVADLRLFIDAVGSGELVSEQSYEEEFAPTTAGLGGATADRYYAMGIGVTNGWLVANPGMPGYKAIVTTLPDKDITIVIYNTETQGNEPEVPAATEMFQSLGTLLAPDQPPKLVGS